MICKECGAYNPDHATYCKVCAANLKGEPDTETVETPVEDAQPTKRFSRPSWVVPEQVKKAEVPADAPEEPIDDDDEFVDEIPEEPVKKPAQKERAVKSEEPTNDELDDDDPDSYEKQSERPIWTPTRTGKRTQPVRVDDDDDDDEEENTKSESEDETIYNDEEALDHDEDSFEYEPTPPKRKSAKKKSNTLFTVLLIAIIVVIVAILVAGGLYFLSKSGVLKCGSDNGSSMMSCAGAKQTNTDNTDLPIADASTTPSNPTEEKPDEKTATISRYVDDTTGLNMVDITVMIPPHATITFECPDQSDVVRTNDKDVSKPYKLKFEEAVFYPGVPLDTPTQTLQPKITITNEDGSSYQVACPSFDVTFPQLEITLNSPVAREDGTFMAAEGNIVRIEGKINDDNAYNLLGMTVNGKETTVYTDGIFMLDYTMSGSESETIEFVATKKNCVTATKTITVDPYVFIPDPMVLDVNGDISSLKADKSGKITVTGTTLPGAELSATSDDTTRVFCGTVNVEPDGKFSFMVSMDASFYGISTITLTGTKEGAEDGSTTFVVSRSYADKDAFVKAYSKTKTYKQVNYDITMTELLSNLGTYASSSYGYRILGTFNEITSDGYVKITLDQTKEVVYVLNMSSKWNPTVSGTRYNVWCNFVGTYQDTGCGEFVGWFGKNK